MFEGETETIKSLSDKQNVEECLGRYQHATVDELRNEFYGADVIFQGLDLSNDELELWEVLGPASRAIPAGKSQEEHMADVIQHFLEEIEKLRLDPNHEVN